MNLSNGSVRFLLLILCIASWPGAQAAVQQDPLPIIANDGSMLAYVYSFSPETLTTTDAGIEVNAEAVRVLLTHPDLPIRSRYQSDGVRAAVLGWSMGGFIGRYALAALEQDGEDHFSAIYLSFDAPHQGAYLPLSLEAFVGLMQEVIEGSDTAVGLSEFNQLLAGASSKYNSLSAKQMLAMHIGRSNAERFSTTLRTRYSQIMSDPATNAAHVEFYTIRDKLRVLGDYPANVRNVALSNGNALGNRLPLPSPRNSNELIRLTASIGRGRCNVYG